MSSALKSVNMTDMDSDQLVDQGGRLLGPRAQQTRLRILETTTLLLSEKKMRDLRVIDIARRIGSSPATFYQYFKDVEDVVLCLAREASSQTPAMVELIHGNWEGAEGLERGRQLASKMMEHWARYGAILLVLNHASEERDEQFITIRYEANMPMINAFAEKIAENHYGGQSECQTTPDPGMIDPMAGAMLLVSVLERVSMYQKDMETLGANRAQLVETAATVLHTTLAARETHSQVSPVQVEQ